MTVEFAGYQLSAGHLKILLDAERAARAEAERQEAEIEARRNQALTIAPLVRARYATAAAEAEIEAARQERLAERKRQERIAAAEDYRQMLLATGRGKWRTVREILDASRGWG